MEFLEDGPRAPARAVLDSNLARINVICTGGTYDDPEHGPTPRHDVQKLRRLLLTRTGRVSRLFEREKPVSCPKCGRSVPIAGSYVDSDDTRGDNGLRYTGGVWLRVVEWHAHQEPDRRVLTVDISDPRYPW